MKPTLANIEKRLQKMEVVTREPANPCDEWFLELLSLLPHSVNMVCAALVAGEMDVIQRPCAAVWARYEDYLTRSEEAQSIYNGLLVVPLPFDEAREYFVDDIPEEVFQKEMLAGPVIFQWIYDNAPRTGELYIDAGRDMRFYRMIHAPILRAFPRHYSYCGLELESWSRDQWETEKPLEGDILYQSLLDRFFGGKDGAK